ncbi:MAG: DUF4176 domain-containing protein [Bacilli bacterium]|nr:DUF4176 domain-containing protein [Bacilli bacterium]
MNINEKYLPVGTVVLLKNAKKRIMVTGFAATVPGSNGKIYDYIACLYPEGVISSDKNLLFDHDQIDKIYYMGYIDDEWKQTEIKINEILQKKANTYNNQSQTEINEKNESLQNMLNINEDLFN